MLSNDRAGMIDHLFLTQWSHSVHTPMTVEVFGQTNLIMNAIISVFMYVHKALDGCASVFLHIMFFYV